MAWVDGRNSDTLGMHHRNQHLETEPEWDFGVLSPPPPPPSPLCLPVIFVWWWVFWPCNTNFGRTLAPGAMSRTPNLLSLQHYRHSIDHETLKHYLLDALITTSGLNFIFSDNSLGNLDGILSGFLCVSRSLERNCHHLRWKIQHKPGKEIFRTHVDFLQPPQHACSPECRLCPQRLSTNCF